MVDNREDPMHLLDSFILAPFIAMLSAFFEARRMACDCRVGGYDRTFVLGESQTPNTCTLVFERRRDFIMLALYPYLMTFSWLYLNERVDGDWMEIAKIVNKLSIKSPPEPVLKLLQRAQLNQQTHYDWSPEAYACFLDDPYMQYTCGRLVDGRGVSIEAAQVEKLRYAAGWLVPQAGDRHLDSGCGWGGLIRYFIEHFDTNSHGITISPGQAACARERVPSDSAEFFVTSFEGFTPDELYDIATVGGVEVSFPMISTRLRGTTPPGVARAAAG